jgi:hypothetical protein
MMRPSKKQRVIRHTNRKTNRATTTLNGLRTSQANTKNTTPNGLNKNKKNGRSFSKVNLPMPQRTLSRPKEMLKSGVKMPKRRLEKVNVSRVTTMPTLNSSKKVRVEGKIKKKG